MTSIPRLLILALLLLAALPAGAQDKPIAIAIHGGAGTILPGQMTEETEVAYREKMTEALRAGYAILNEGGSSVDAVVAAVQVLEESPLFNAGRGAVLTSEGTAELDASIMEGEQRMAGAVAGVKQVKSPIELARRVMEASPHVMLAGEGAEFFALDQSLEMVDNDYFITDRRMEQLRRMQRAEEDDKHGTVGAVALDGSGNLAAATSTGGMSNKRFGQWGVCGYFITDRGKEQLRRMQGAEEDDKHGTVGAVALDGSGNLAAATSTGGMSNKKFGRVGDSPIIGAGTYADNETAAVSATGHGEYFIRGVVAYDIAAMMRYADLTLSEAANAVIHERLTDMGGTGGVIAMDAGGNISMPFNTAGMYRGYIDTSGELHVAIYGD